MSSTPIYDSLPLERRLEIERELFKYLLGEDYSARSIPDGASSRKQEYLISCIRDAIHRSNDRTVIPPHEVDPTREINARRLTEKAGTPVDLVSARDTREALLAQGRELMGRLAFEGRLPHRLEDYMAQAECYTGTNADGQPVRQKRWVMADQILLEEGQQIAGLQIDPQAQSLLVNAEKGPVLPVTPALVNGVECRVLVTRETGIPRKRIAERYLKQLGYKHQGQRGGRGYVAFQKDRSDGSILTCNFDFGSWRASVIVLFAYSIGSLTLRFPVQYWTEMTPVEIVTRKMFERTMENVAAVVERLEAFVAASGVC